MSTPSALVRAPSTLDSDLPVVVFAPATPQIDSDAPPELDSRVSRVSAEPGKVKISPRGPHHCPGCKVHLMHASTFDGVIVMY